MMKKLYCQWVLNGLKVHVFQFNKNNQHLDLRDGEKFLVLKDTRYPTIVVSNRWYKIDEKTFEKSLVSGPYTKVIKEMYGLINEDTNHG